MRDERHTDGRAGVARMRLRATIAGLLGFAAVLAAGVPAAGAATFDWQPVQTLSAGGAGAELPQVAIADDGRAIAMWRAANGDCKERLWASYRKRGENFGPPKPVSFPSGLACENTVGGQIGRSFRLRMNRAGEAVVVYLKTSASGAAHLMSNRKSAAASEFQIQGEHPVDTTDSWFEPDVALSEAGDATVIYHGQPHAFNSLFANRRSMYRWRSRPAGATSWSESRFLLPHAPCVETNCSSFNETAGAIATDEAGNLLAGVAQQERLDDGTLKRQEMVRAFKSPSATTWQVSSRHDTDPFGLYPLDEDAVGTDVAASTLGDVLGWREGQRVTAVRNTSSSILSDPHAAGEPSAPSVGVDTKGNALAVWTQSSSVDAGFSPAGSPGFEIAGDAVPGGTFTAPRTDPDLAVGRSDTGLVAFEEECGPSPSAGCPDGGAEDDQTVRAAIRQAGARTTFDAPETLSVPGDLEFNVSDKRTAGPKVAFNAVGEGVAVWARTGSESDFVVEAAQVIPDDPTPPGPGKPGQPGGSIPKPPPPPPPPPPIPSAIELARPLERGAAVVLTAKVDGPVTSLQWSFATKDEPQIVVTAGADGQVPRSIRLRHPERSFTATLIARGPGGTRVFKRNLVQPKDPTAKDAKQVLEGLDRANASGVFATGDAAGLIGDGNEPRTSSWGGPVARAAAACSPLTIWSGQQKLAGCFKPVEKLGDIPAREKGAVKQLADELKLDESKPELMQQAMRLTDSYVSEGRAVLNDTFPVTPGQAASIVSMPQAETLFSAKAELPVGQAKYDPKNGFNLKLDPKKATIPLGPLPNPPKLPSLAGLEIVGDWNVNLDKREAKIKASVKLPPSIKKSGVQISNQVNLRATPDRIIVDEVRVGPIDVDIASLKVNKFQIQYKREPDQWDGQGKACLVGTACLDMIPANGGVTIKNGDLSQAGATLAFPPPGLPLFTGVNLERVGFGLGLRPTRIFGSARVGVAQIIKLDGRIFVAFPTSENPFVLDRKEVGNAYPPHLYGSRFNRFTFGATAEALVVVPIIGETKLGSAYVLYEYPGYTAFGGGYDASVLDLLGIRGGVSAEADAEQGVFDLHGEVKACLYLADLDLCSGATGHVSRGRNGTGGAGACVDLGLVTVGGGVLWKDLSDPYIWPIDGCRWSPFRVQVRQTARAARAGGKSPRASATQLVRGNASRAVRERESDVGVSRAGTYTIKIEKDNPNPVLRLDGTGTAPAIRVTGPGVSIEAPAGSGFYKTPDNKIRIMRLESRYAKITSIGFQDATPGTYQVQVLPGSSPVVSVQQATDPPPAQVKGDVRGKGRNRVLRYDVAPRPNQKVVFSELTPTGAAQQIGTTAGGRGRIRFRSAPGHGRRRILAQFELAGIPAERRIVTRFKPQSPVMPRPRRVKLHRVGGRLRVSWRKVPGARRYEISLTPSSRRMSFARTRRSRTSLKVPRWEKGRVTVRAVDDLRQSRIVRRRFRAVTRRPSAFRSFPRCKVAKKKIRCGKAKGKKRPRSKAKGKSRRGR